MKILTARIPERLLDAIDRVRAREHRSRTGQVIHLLTLALMQIGEIDHREIA